jgi:hypothetical protein
MSQLWSRALEWFGRIRLGGFGRMKLRVGRANAPDAKGDFGWKRFLSAERLYDAWGPAPDGQWLPFHCVPLFAALDRLPSSDVGPATPTAESDVAPGAGQPARPPLPPHARPGAPLPRWIAGDTWTILDLPGPRTVEAAAWLVRAAGMQPVCTFDNWPNPRGVLRAEDILAELLRWVTTIEAARERITAQSPPLWICDSERLGTRAGSPGEFDNRYYLDDSIMPGVALLRSAGIRRVVYVTLDAAEIPVLDLEPYLGELLAAGLDVRHVDLSDAALEPRPFVASPQRPALQRTSFRRSAAGGFGTEVPQPSSGGSS